MRKVIEEAKKKARRELNWEESTKRYRNGSIMATILLLIGTYLNIAWLGILGLVLYALHIYIINKAMKKLEEKDGKEKRIN